MSILTSSRKTYLVCYFFVVYETFPSLYSTKVVFKGMLHETPSQRPKLTSVLSSLKILTTVVDTYKLTTSTPIIYSVNGRVKSVQCRDKDERRLTDFLVLGK